MTQESKKHLNRETWLEKAMQVLSQEGAANLNIEGLSKAMGLTKGSFYTHFEDRTDFVHRLVSFWQERFTFSVIRHIDAMQNVKAEIRLLELARLLQGHRMARFENAIRTWANREPEVAKAVEKIDEERFTWVQSLFYEIGFRGIDLDTRTRLFVVYYSSDHGSQLPVSGVAADEEIRARHEFFVRT